LKNLPKPQKSGVLLIDKPADFSSHDIIAIVRRILQTKTIGHSGTLDPMATGLLILLVGRTATQRQPEFLQLSKTYHAVLKLGTQTDTWDRYGQPVSTTPVPPICQLKLTDAIHKLSGTVLQQVPPFSAKKIKGEKMYDLARKGVQLAPRFSQVDVHWENVVWQTPDEISFTLTGSCGTYVRALGYMLARELGTVGHLAALRRVAIGPYQVQHAFDGNLLKDCPTETLYNWVQSV
ncbi:MAG: tRNA pseudouridine(55) synthase TruB, partial [Elusimicrobiaceae bacterium]|nr:tRNA pseudouridine(55) synthase TruB [Elusimicrobiaceae bacterium]